MSVLAWMVHAVLVGLLVTAAAWALERVPALRGGSRRWIWAGALALSVALPLAGLLRVGGADPASGMAAGSAERTPVALAAAGTEGGPLSGAARLAAVVVSGARDLPGRAAGLVRGVESTVATRIPPDSPVHRAAPGLWIFLTLAGLGALALSGARLARVRRRWSPQSVEGRDVLVSRSTGPAVVGVRRPEIVLPAWALGLDPEAVRLILLHEGEHLSAGDTRLLAGGIAAGLLMPWNPVLWYQLRRLREGVELDCDRRVLRAGVPPHRYGRILVAVAARSGPHPPPALALAEGPSLLERRLKQMKRSHARLPKLTAGAATLAAVALLAVACEVDPPVAPTPDAAEVESPSATVSDATDAADGRVWTVRREAEDAGSPAPDGARLTLEADGRRISMERGTLTLRRTPSRPSPLLVIDGVIAGSDVDAVELDPDRIERIEMVKGAAAAGLYGPRAADGVILVFTRDAADTRDAAESNAHAEPTRRPFMRK